MNRQGVTLQDIALRTGVSKVTVSYVLNDRESRVRISDSTRQRVLTAAREMGYHPNAVARALARRCTDTITLVMQSPSVFAGGSGFMSELMHGVLEAANVLGYDLMLHTKPLPSVDAEVRALTDGRADGVLVLRDLDDPLAAALSGRKFPCVVVFARTLDPSICFVDCDNIAGGRLAASYLWDLGHRRLGFVGGSAASSAVRDRRAGFMAALSERGAALHPDDEITVTFAGGDFSPLIARLRRPDPPTALFFWSDDIAAAAIAVLRRELGLRVPDDLSVIGFDDAPAVCERSVPRLTSIRQPIETIARRALEVLVTRIQTGAAPVTAECFPPSLVERESCAPFAFEKGSPQ
jgi:LacI family transcriptional regulator